MDPSKPVRRKVSIVLSDVDGTITAPGDDDSVINLLPGALETFNQLAQAGTIVVIISARPMDLLVKTFITMPALKIPNLILVSNDGCVIRHADGEFATLRERPDYAEIKIAAADFAKRVTDSAAIITYQDMDFVQGIFVKPSNPRFQDVGDFLRKLVTGSETLTVKEHKQGWTVELTDKPGKEEAVSRILGGFGENELTVHYGGDGGRGGNDEKALRLVTQMGGNAILIDSDPAAGGDYATQVVAAPEDWHTYLKQLL